MPGINTGDWKAYIANSVLSVRNGEVLEHNSQCSASTATEDLAQGCDWYIQIANSMLSLESVEV